MCLFWWLYGFLWWVFAIEKLEYIRYNTKKYELVFYNSYSSDFFLILTDLTKAFVEFCVIEVFKFWVILQWMKEGCKSLSLGMPRNPKLLSKNEQPTKLGDAPEWHPLFLLTTVGILLESIFLFVTWYVFAWSVLYYMSLCLFCFLFCHKYPCWTHLFERAKTMLWFVRIALHASLNFFELWSCSSASLISFWAWCALVFLKKCSLASLRFIWELVKFSRNSLLLHLN